MYKTQFNNIHYKDLNIYILNIDFFFKPQNILFKV